MLKTKLTASYIFRVIELLGLAYLAMNKGCNGHIPSCVRGHAKAKERPNPVVVEWGYEHCGSTTSSKNVGPSPLVQVIIDVVYVTAYPKTKNILFSII